MNKLWIYRIAVILLAGGLAVALFVKNAEPASDVETVSVISGWRNVEPSEVEDNFVKLLHENTMKFLNLEETTPLIHTHPK